MNPVPISHPCPCGLPAALEACCGRYFNGLENAPTPEALMRSRYTAFALATQASVEYLLATHHADHRRAGLERDLREGLGETRFTSLKILHASSEGDSGVVEFVAGFVQGGRMGEMRERSLFVREDGRWLYTMGF